jgi:hypothetical protein
VLGKGNELYLQKVICQWDNLPKCYFEIDML